MNDDSEHDPGMFWLNLIGCSTVLGLVTAFVLLYGRRSLELLTWFLARDAFPDR